MSNIPDWFTLSEAIKHIEDAGDADAMEILRRACADGNVRSRGIVDGTSRNLGPEWWHPGVSIDIASGRITKGRTSKNVAIRALTSRQDRLGPEDFDTIPVRGNLAETVDISSPDIDRFSPKSGAKDGEEVEKSVDLRNAKPRPQTTSLSPLIDALRTQALEGLAENTNAGQ